MIKVDLNETLSSETWGEGKVIPVAQASARHKTVIHCSPSGRQEHMFKNGKNNTAAYVELTRPDGSWISHGAAIVPVLPDGRLLMVVEQRPPQGRYDQATHFVTDGREVNLTKFGLYSSLEFPGGAVDSTDKSFKAGFLRELTEETGVEPTGKVYMGKHLVHAFGSDIAIAGVFGVMYLSGMKFDKHVDTDGGLAVFALKPEDVRRNWHLGNIRSGQAALLGYLFYREVAEMIESDNIDPDFVSVEEVRLDTQKAA